MGTFIYDGTLRVDFEDRLLLHLQLVIAAKLRRNESFFFTWTRSGVEGEGRTSVWVDRTIPITFEYPTLDVPSVSQSWIDELTHTTFRVGGLQIVPDPGVAAAPPPRPPKRTARVPLPK